jgi:hypothetical protein
MVAGTVPIRPVVPASSFAYLQKQFVLSKNHFCFAQGNRSQALWSPHLVLRSLGCPCYRGCCAGLGHHLPPPVWPAGEPDAPRASTGCAQGARVGCPSKHGAGLRRSRNRRKVAWGLWGGPVGVGWGWDGGDLSRFLHGWPVQALQVGRPLK